MAKFRARARTLDLLGRQQIASRPTAISELFKNAHDAYAKVAVVDLFRSDLLLVLRDDGIGMTREEFEQRWLTIGTESKASDALEPDPPTPPKGVMARPMLGEKGIGRLAIASLGNQVLVLSRAVRDGVPQDLVAAFVPWLVFSCPGIDLGEIEIPVKTFGQNSFPAQVDLREMVAESRKNIHFLHERVKPELARKIIEGLKSFDFDPRSLAQSLGEPSLLKGGTGTHFYVRPATHDLLTDIQSENPDRASRLEKMLVGFTNDMIPGRVRPDFSVRFVHHKTDDASEEVLEQSPFKPEDFEVADHRLSGRFDANGKFKGKLRIYEQEMDYVLESPYGKKYGTRCGPFQFEFAYVHGDIKDSLLYEKDQVEYYRLVDLMKRFSGVYVYRDGVRILPYGDSEFDWLEIEERRTKGASYYFFSYRRMFGAVDLNTKENSTLKEKAGREGFIDDEAYRELRKLLMGLLVNIAADHFRAEAAKSETYEKQRTAINEREDLRRRRETESKQKRAAFERKLEEETEKLDAREPKQVADAVLRDLRQELGSTVAELLPELAAERLGRLESHALNRIREIRERLSIKRPRGVGLSDRLQRTYDDYVERVEVVDKKVLRPAEAEVEDLIESAAKQLEPELKRRKRAEAALQGAVEKARRIVDNAKHELHRASSQLSNRLKSMTDTAEADLLESVKASKAKLSDQELFRKGAAEFQSCKEEATDRLREVGEATADKLTKAQEALAWVNQAIEKGLKDTPDDLAEALEEEVIALKERESADLELAQLGMAIQVINHEFSASIKAVRSALRRLKGWADANQQLGEVYQEVRTTFDHLDGYLTLFTPLQRRLYRAQVEITGANIYKFLNDLFRDRMDRHGVTLTPSKSFLEHRFDGYPSTFYPVFTNLVDNSIYWLGHRSGEKLIHLDYQSNQMIVSDSGPGISKRDRAALFKRGFTRKPAGRGLGLYISRALLARDGFEISLVDDDRQGRGVAWVISKRKR